MNGGRKAGVRVAGGGGGGGWGNKRLWLIVC